MAKEERRTGVARRSKKGNRRSSDSVYSKPERRQHKERRTLKERRKKH